MAGGGSLLTRRSAVKLLCHPSKDGLHTSFISAEMTQTYSHVAMVNASLQGFV